MNSKHPHHEAGHPPKTGWKPHTDWRFWAVILMLVGIGIYVVTLDESLVPAGNAPRVPAAAP